MLSLQSKQGTLIDYAFQRTAQTDAISKQAYPDRHATLLMPQGMQHIPILGSIPWPRVPHTKPLPGPKVPTMQQAHTAIAATPGLAQAFRAQVESALAADPGPSCLNDKLARAWEIVAPAAQPPPDRTDTQWPAQIRQMWQLRRSLKSLSTANVTAALLWKQWVQVIRLQKLQKVITKQARERKSYALRTFLQEIDQPGFGSLMSRVYKAAKPLSDLLPRPGRLQFKYETHRDSSLTKMVHDKHIRLSSNSSISPRKLRQCLCPLPGSKYLLV